MADEMGIFGEILCLAVLQDKEATSLQEAASFTEDKVGQLLQLWQRIRRVGEDEVIGARCFLQETQDIGPQEGDIRLGLQLAQETKAVPA